MSGKSKLASLAMVAALALGACGGDDADTTEDDTLEEPADTGTETEETTP